MGFYISYELASTLYHDDIIIWKLFPRYCPFVRGIHRSPVNSPHEGQWRGSLMFSLICAWIRAWVNNRDAGDLRRHRTHYDVTVMSFMWDPGQHCVSRRTRFCWVLFCCCHIIISLNSYHVFAHIPQCCFAGIRLIVYCSSTIAAILKDRGKIAYSETCL